MFSYPRVARRSLAAGLALSAGMLAYALAPATAAPLSASKIVLKSAISVDPVANTVVLPVHKGTSGGKTVWYIITDSSDKADADARGVVFSPLLAAVGATQEVKENGDAFAFTGAPDISPDRAFAPGPGGFPPAKAAPGATAPATYSPFVHIGPSKTILNAPIIATGDGPFDVTTHKNTAERVLAIDDKTVTLLLAHGFAAGRAVVYISTGASDAGAAAIERATFVPSLGKAAAKIPILVFVNGQTGAGNPQAQGLAHAALDTHLTDDATSTNAARLASPNNVLSAFPSGATSGAYTPLWDATVGVWSTTAVNAKKNTRQISAPAVYALASSKSITGPGGKAFGPAGFVVNCPVIAYIDDAP